MNQVGWVATAAHRMVTGRFGRRSGHRTPLEETCSCQSALDRGRNIVWVSQATEALPPTPNIQNPGKPKYRDRFKPIDKSVLALPEPRRERDRNHVKAVAQHHCLICGRRPADAHLRFAQSHALGRKVSDEYAVPLCRGHHREVHHCGDEAAWWRNVAIDPLIVARALWLETHPLPVATAELRPAAEGSDIR